LISADDSLAISGFLNLQNGRISDL